MSPYKSVTYVPCCTGAIASISQAEMYNFGIVLMLAFLGLRPAAFAAEPGDCGFGVGFGLGVRYCGVGFFYFYFDMIFPSLA